MEKKNKLIILGVIILLLIASGLTFAILTWNSTMIKLGINTNCFTIDYVKGGDITGSLKLINEEDLISNGKFTIKEGVGVSSVNIGINSNCSIEGYGSILLNITNISNAFTTGSSKGALKYAVLKNTSTITDPTQINTTSLLNQSFDIEKKGSIDTNGTIKLFTSILSNTELYKYIIVIYVDNNLAGNDITSATFQGNISAEAGQLEQLEPTPEYCFATSYNESDMTAELIGYNCGKNNGFGYEEITDVMVVPSSIGQIEITGVKKEPTEEAKNMCYLTLYAFLKDMSEEDRKDVCNGKEVNGVTLETIISNKEITENFDVKSYLATTGMYDIKYNDEIMYKVTSMDGAAIDISIIDFFDAKYVVLPNTIINIGGYTFAHSGLTSIVIPDSVTTISTDAFESSNLNYVYIGNNSSLTSIGNYGFTSNSSSNPNLRYIYNNSGKVFDWKEIVVGSDFTTTDGGVTGEVTTTNNYGKVIITTGGPR